jgi:Transposase DDE domain
MLEFSDRIASEQFAQLARHPDSPKAFTRCRKLPLPALVASLLTMRGQSQQVMLDTFFGSVCGAEGLHRAITDRGFARARSCLHVPALTSLNDFIIQRAEAAGIVPRWRGLRVLAADGSVLMPAVRSCHRSRSAAGRDQRLFALFLPGAELTLHAAVYGCEGAERQMLVEALELLGPDDVLVLDRGYPAAWLVALLNERGIRFCMRCDNDSSWSALTTFMRGSADEAWVTLKAASADDAAVWGCSRTPPKVRLVRQITPTGAVRVLATNLDEQAAPAHAFAELYHQRWRIEEAFKRLKHRMKLECISGLSQHALLIDVAAKVLADNLASLMCIAAAKQAAQPQQPSRRCNRAYAAALLQRTLPRLILLIGDFFATLAHALRLLAATTQRFIPGRSRPRPAHHVKPHPSAVYKG